MLERSKPSCDNCIGACCVEGTIIPLTDAESMQLESAGTDLKLVPKSDWQGNKPGRGRNFYLMQSDCGNLLPPNEDGARYCGDYENRPKECRGVKVGQYTCKLMRLAHGVDQPRVPVDITIGSRPN